MTSVNKTLSERGQRYGNFMAQAKIGQALKNVLSLQTGWLLLADDQREALENICTKMARITNGDPDWIDNWHDIAGYAALVEKRLEKGK